MRTGNPGGQFSDRVVPGAKFDMLTVVRRLPKNEKGRYTILCRCECGGECTPNVDNLLSGNTKSCGCRRRANFTNLPKEKRGVRTGYKTVFPGARFGRLEVVELRRKVISETRNRAAALCKCDCGNTKEVVSDGLVNGAIRSCGCLWSETTAARNRATAKYGCFSSEHPRTFTAWASMIDRCYREKSTLYPAYGGAGVIVCCRLRRHPQNLANAIGYRKKAKPSLDRYPIHNGNYTCGECKECRRNGWAKNVRWATSKEQAENRGDFNVWLTAFGKTLLLCRWEELTGIDARLISCRVKRDGWSVEKALATPDSNGNCYRPSIDI